MITTMRGKNLNHLLMKDGTEVGYAKKIPGRREWSVQLYGIYWRKGEPNNRSGGTGVGVRRLMDAAPLAERVDALFPL
jgi:hypothetical protein